MRNIIIMDLLYDINLGALKDIDTIFPKTTSFLVI